MRAARPARKYLRGRGWRQGRKPAGMSANAHGHGPGGKNHVMTVNDLDSMGEQHMQQRGLHAQQQHHHNHGLEAGAAGNPITITRRLNIKIQGSMSDFAQDGQGCATWRGVEGKQAVIWGLQDVVGAASGANGLGSGSTHNSATHALSSAVIQSAVLLEHKSTFKVPLGVTINCLPCNEMTGFGEAYCYTVLPESNNTVPTQLFQATDESEEGNRWR